jgi:hypothetical protein
MLTVTATFDLTMLYFVAANVIFLLAYVLVIKHRARVIQRHVTLVSAAIAEYFRKNGSEVSVETISRARGKRFIALVSSRPSRRFRNSHVMEMVLTTHVRKVCGMDLEKVYWCFPVKSKQDGEQREGASAEGATISKVDDYFDEELSTVSKPPGYRVKELTLEKFEAVAGKQKSAGSPEPSRPEDARPEPSRPKPSRLEPWVAAAD